VEPFEDIAERRYPDAAWIMGDGPFALLAHCSGLKVTLHKTHEDAERSKSWIDDLACGGGCTKHHEIINLQE
jgi:hypothetical protein